MLERRDRRLWVCSLGVILPWWRSSAPLPCGGGVELCLRLFVCGVVSLRLVIDHCFLFLNDMAVLLPLISEKVALEGLESLVAYKASLVFWLPPYKHLSCGMATNSWNPSSFPFASFPSDF
jgi:hypothetical protein